MVKRSAYIKSLFVLVGMLFILLFFALNQSSHKTNKNNMVSSNQDDIRKFFQSKSGTFYQAAKVKFGFYPVGIYNLDPANGSFMADFYAWMIYNKSARKLCPEIEHLESVNGEALQIETQPYPLTDTSLCGVWFRVRGKFYHSFDVHKYPFDKQNLEIQLENPVSPQNELGYNLVDASSYTIDSSQTSAVLKNSSSLGYSGWKVDSIKHIIRIHSYGTNWGIKEDVEAYSQNVLRIVLTRHSWQHLMEILIPLIATMILTTLVFFLSADDLSSAIEICVIMFIGVVEQQHGFITQMPDVGYFITADYYFLGTYFYIALCLIMVLIIHHFSKIGLEKKVYVLSKLSKVFLPISYMIFVLIISYPIFR